MGAMEAALQAKPAASRPYLVGSKLSFADLYLIDVADYLTAYLGTGCLDAYPLTRANVAAVCALPRIAAYIASPQRYPMSGAAYVDAVHRILEP
jgi:glutathione S-transferase